METYKEKRNELVDLTMSYILEHLNAHMSVGICDELYNSMINLKGEQTKEFVGVCCILNNFVEKNYTQDKIDFLIDSLENRNLQYFGKFVEEVDKSVRLNFPSVCTPKVSQDSKDLFDNLFFVLAQVEFNQLKNDENELYNLL